MLTNVLLYGFTAFLLTMFCIICWHKLLNMEIDYRSYKFYIALFVGVVLGTMINFLLPPYLKIIINITMLILTNYFLFTHSLSKSIITIIISQLVIMLSEMVMVLIMAIIFMGNVTIWQDNYIITFFVNVGVAAMSFLSLKCSLIYKLYNFLEMIFNNIKNNHLILLAIFTIILASLLMIMSWMHLPKYITVVLSTILIIVYVSIIVQLLYTEAKLTKVRGKYEISLSSLKEYENIMDKYRLLNHENKNQLLTIRNMVKSKDKGVTKYIENLVEDKIKDDETIFYKTSKIPEGGLRATIYSKLCAMKEKDIDYKLDIANDVRTIDLINIGENTILDMCKILGVFLDNAIEAVDALGTKKIIIELFVMDDYVYIDISNNYEEAIDFDKIGFKNYTTKGKGHGYGLELVQKIIKQNELLETEKIINRQLFKQRLKIKIKQN